MRLLKQIAAGVMVTWGGIFILAGFAALFDEGEEERMSAFLGCMMLGGPPLVWGGLIYRNLSRSASGTALKEGGQPTQTEIQDMFFWLLETNGGEITLMRFAMETRLPAEDAREFLDEAATQFNASFRVGDRGEIYYQFPIGETEPRSLPSDPSNPPTA